VKKGFLPFFLFLFFPLFGQLPPGYVAYFPLDGHTRDLSPFHLDGFGYQIIPAFGIVNGAFLFNGFNSTITSSTFNRHIIDTVTIAAWFKTNASNHYGFIAAKYNWVEDRGYHLSVYWDGYGFLGGRNNGGQYQIIRTLKRVNDGQWHHLAGVVEGNTWKLYLDGRLQGVVHSSSIRPDLQNSDPFTIGYYYRGDNGCHCYFNGIIDEVILYNRALTDREIRVLANPYFYGISDQSAEGFAVFPNPIKKEEKIRVTSAYPLSSIRIYDLTGRLIFEYRINPPSTIWEEEFPARKKGVYLLQAETNHQIITRKILVE